MEKNRSLERTVVRNASANVLRLAGSGIVALLLQLTLYVGYLDFGIQTAVARFVAHANELDHCEERDGIVSTAFVMLTIAMGFGCLLVVLLVCQLPVIFRQMPAELYRPAKVALLFMGCSFALSL